VAERIVEVAETACRISVRGGLLRLDDEEGRELDRVVLSELACLVLGHPRLVVSHAALGSICAAGGSVVVTDEKRCPVAWVLPLGRHSTMGERFRAQAAASAPLRKRLWQAIVKAKIGAQGRLLQELTRDDAGLPALAARVRSGDPENLEARASQRYWPRLFGDARFRRRRDGEDQNRLLNYGYTVLRALVARAICGAGLHPKLGVHHHGRYDAMPLADDLMEPLRPLVDRAVAKLVAARGPAVPMDRETRGALLAIFLERYESGGESRTLFDLMARSAASLAQSFETGRPGLWLPEL
jgi:CRISPR-associated protein Cas1